MLFSEVFQVCPESPSGLVWRSSKKEHLNGKPCGYRLFRSNGKPKAWRVEFNNKSYAVHRIVWEILTGGITPELEVDHKDGNPFNNCIDNLRTVPHKINARNQAQNTANKTGVTGVYVKQNKRQSYLTATWRDLEGNPHSKNFSVVEHGYDTALRLATKHRETEINKLNQLGAGYTDRHGENK